MSSSTTLTERPLLSNCLRAISRRPVGAMLAAGAAGPLALTAIYLSAEVEPARTPAPGGAETNSALATRGSPTWAPIDPSTPSSDISESDRMGEMCSLLFPSNPGRMHQRPERPADGPNWRTGPAACSRMTRTSLPLGSRKLSGDWRWTGWVSNRSGPGPLLIVNLQRYFVSQVDAQH